MTNKKLPENATKTEGAELARRGRGEISAATAVPHVSYDDLRHADRITIDGLEVFANHGVYPEENALGQKFVVSLVLYADLRAALLLGVRVKLDKPWAPVGLPLASCGVEIERVR